MKSFSHVMHHIPDSEIDNINWKSLMLVCVKLIKFDPVNIKNCKQLCNESGIS